MARGKALSFFLARLVAGGWIGLIALLVTGLGAGCQSVKKSAADTDHDGFGRNQRRSLNAAVPYDKLFVEIDAVEGFGPSDYELAEIKSFLAASTHKPGGVTIRQSDVIPQAVAAQSSATALALNYLNGPPDDHSAFIYILFYRSKLVDPHAKANQPHAHYFPFPGAIFIDRSYVRIVSWLFPRTTWPSFLRHELGHTLGLAVESDHSKNGHCTAPNCVMYGTLRFQARRLLAFRQPWANTELCADCKRDLLAYKRVETSPLNERMWHGYFLRESDGYQIVTRPGFVFVHFGTLADLSLDEIEIKRQEALSDRSQWAWKSYTSDFDVVRDPGAMERLLKTDYALFGELGRNVFKNVLERVEAAPAADPAYLRLATSDAMMISVKVFPELIPRFEALRKKAADDAAKQ